MTEAEEIFDVVDENDQVVGQASRKEVHAKGLIHRSVHILVFNEQGELFLQKRSMNKDENPGYWDTSAAGHVNAGEDYEPCAHRELEEELGIRTELREIGRFSARPETFAEHVRVYSGVAQSSITINKDEISEGRFWTFEEIDRAMEKDTTRFTSTFNLILNQFGEQFR